MQSSTTLAILLHADREGGAEVVTRRLAASLGRRGLEPDFVVVSGEPPSEPPQGTRLVALGAPRIALSVPRLARYLARARPRAVLSSLTHINLATLLAHELAPARCRVVLSEQSVLSRARVGAAFARERLYPRAAALLYRRADALVCSSEAMATDLARVTGLPRSEIAVIPNSVSRDELVDAARRAPAHPWLAPGEPPLIVAAARLERVKALDVLIDAVAAVRRRRPVRLIVVGEGSQRHVLERRVRAVGLEACVSLPGFHPNPYGLIAGAAVVALSSVREGLPTVLVEALALSRPVVATDCASGPREILAGGRYGRLVPPGDVQALAGALCAALDDGGDPAPPEALARYDPEFVADRYLEVLGLSNGASA